MAGAAKTLGSTSSLEKMTDEQFEKKFNELEGAENEEELEKKWNSWARFGFSLPKWMSLKFNKDMSKEEFKAEWLTIDEYISLADQSQQQSWEILNAPNWRVEKKGTTKGDVVESLRNANYGKIHRFTGIVDCPAAFLYTELKENLTKISDWNPTILSAEIIKEIRPDTDLTYQVTAGGGGGMIAPRDFTLLRRLAALKQDGQIAQEGEQPYCYISSGISVKVPGYPPNKDIVRGNNKIGCWFLKPVFVKTSSGQVEEKTSFQWLMCCDLNCKIPQFVLDAAFSTVMLEYIVHVRKFVADSKAKGTLK